MKDRSDVIFLTVALTLTAGVPIALFTVYYFADSIIFVAAINLLILACVATLGILIARHKDQILAALLQRTSRYARDLSNPFGQSVQAYVEGDLEQGRQQLDRFFQGLVSHYAWLQTRRWIITSAVGLLLGFAGLIGSALLKQQNDLLAKQLQFFSQQIAAQRSQIELQQDVANQSVRSQAILRIYGPAQGTTPRVKSEAVRSLIAVERVRIAQGNNSLPTRYINLHNAELEAAWLDSADLQKVSFRASKLRRANFNSANVGESVFRFAKLQKATFIGANANGTHFMFSSARDSVFSNADLSDANINQTDLHGALLNNINVKGATLHNVNLENANLDNIRNWKEINSIEGTNIHGVRNAPEGFKAWALKNGAIDQAGALSDLDQRAKAMQSTEETAQ
ncbi:MAG: pentapeptide repeat-containing protein [Hyphomicrobiaceae bacterium]